MAYETYLAVWLVKAERQTLKVSSTEPGSTARMDVPGYQVIHPNGNAEFLGEAEFEALYRPLSRHERQVVEMTDAEAQVSAISDGRFPDDRPNVVEEDSASDRANAAFNQRPKYRPLSPEEERELEAVQRAGHEHETVPDALKRQAE